MKFSTDVLEMVYRSVCGKLGWMSKLTDEFWEPEHRSYLEWLDEHESWAINRLRTWERKSFEQFDGFELWEEVDDRKRLSLVNRAIAMLERQADEFDGESRFLFLGLSDIEALAKLRWLIRSRLIGDVDTSWKTVVSETELETARNYPLSRLLAPIPRNKMLNCPFHTEKTPSFHVTTFGYCFGCGRWIDSIGWLQLKGSSFREAVKTLSSNN